MKKALILIVLCSFALALLTAPLLSQPIFRVKKGARGTVDKSWTWEIEKVADESELLLSTGQTHIVNYTVTVTASLDGSWTVIGGIGVANISGAEAVLGSVVDQLSDGTFAEVTCEAPFPVALAPYTPPVPNEGFFQCTYEASGVGEIPLLNTASAYLEDGTLGGQFTREVSIAASTETDECVDVDDTLGGALGQVCATDPDQTFTFNYPVTVGPYDECETVDQICNVASFLTNDTGDTKEAQWCVDVRTAPCDEGCTLTPGYWKTHSRYGPAPYDDTWAVVGEDTVFFLSGQSWYEVLWTSPAGGNAYYVLAHAYIAAQLNLINGASSTAEVDAALTDATTFFETYTPAEVGSWRGNLGERQAALAWAETLDNYNNGLTGPGHCSE